MYTLEGHIRQVNSCSFSPDTSMVVSCSDDGTVKVQDVATEECIHTLEGHTHRITSCSSSHVAPMVVSCSGDKTVKVWDLLV